MLEDDQTLFAHLDSLSRQRALTDAESRLLELAIRRLDDRAAQKPRGYERWIATRGKVIG